MLKLKNITLTDLTHTLSSKIPYWDDGCGFQDQVTLDYAACTAEVKFRTQKLTMAAGIGTHMDAPAHCISQGKTIDELSLDQLVAPLVMIDVAARAHEKYVVTAADILAFEKQHGKIAKEVFVIIYTGWEKFWNDAKKYRNDLIFPSVSKEAAELLLNREIIGLGIDTLSPDIAASEFPVHQLILGAGKYLVENVANTKQLPPIGAYVLVLPIKVLGGTEAPVRLVAIEIRET